MIDLFLARHGDTFNSGDKVVWVGSRNNLPLTLNGQRQALVIADYFRAKQINLAQIYCGPLDRAASFAEIIGKSLNGSKAIQVSSELNELDYGDWSGLSNSEISEKFGQEELEGWEKRGVWPKNGNWGGSDAAIATETRNWIDQITKLNRFPILAVTSNGRLRYFWRLCENTPPEKVATGNLCHLRFSAGKWNIVSWNQNP